jgi:hypothetical protein
MVDDPHAAAERKARNPRARLRPIRRGVLSVIWVGDVDVHVRGGVHLYGVHVAGSLVHVQRVAKHRDGDPSIGWLSRNRLVTRLSEPI